MKKPLSLPHLRAFEAAARHVSFRQAADELFITTGAVSRHIRSLEDKLGIQLFYRAHKSVKLTEAGSTFSVMAAKVLRELSEYEEKIRDSAPSRGLTVECLPTFAMHWLSPRLSEFRGYHPELKVDLTTSVGKIRLESNFDIAIRRDPEHFSGLDSVHFLNENSVLVCSKNYALRNTLVSPDNLDGHTLIQIRAREDLWSKWTAEFPKNTKNSTEIIHLDHTFAAIQAAEDGLGLAVIPKLFCNRHLESGRLITPFDDISINTGGYFLILRDRRDSDVMGFLSWLKTLG